MEKELNFRIFLFVERILTARRPSASGWLCSVFASLAAKTRTDRRLALMVVLGSAKFAQHLVDFSDRV